MIQFNSISIRNFLSVESLDFQFKEGKHIILGRNNDAAVASSNGAGKSSLIEAISFVLYRDYPRKEVCRRGCQECSVTLDVTINDRNYVITRTSNHAAKNSMEIILDGENVTAKGIRQAEKEIISAIGLPYNLFISSIIIPQGYPVNISQLTPTSRKNIIESLLGLLVWEDYQDIFSSVSKEYQSKHLAISSHFDERKEAMTDLYGRIKGMKEFTEEHLASLEADMSAIKSYVKELMKERDKLTEQVEQASSQSIDALQDDSSKILYSINQLSSKKRDIERSLGNGECYACHRPYSQDEIDKMNANISFLTNKLDKLQASSKEINDVVSEIQGFLYDRQNITRKIEVKRQELTSLAESYKKHSENEKIPAMEAELESLVEEVNSVKEEMEEVEREKDNVAFICSSLLPSSKFRTKLVGSYVQVLNQIIEEVASLVFPEFTIRLVSSSNEAGIDVSITDRQNNTVSYYSLSGGEKRRIDIILTLSVQRFLLESSFTDSNLLVFDEIFDNLDANASNTVLAAINNLFGEEKAIYVISHNDSIKSMFESSITAEKTDGVTQYDLSNYQ